MNTNKLKAYAPKARVAFMEAVKSKAAKLGIFEDRISEIIIDGDNAIIEKEVYTRKQGQQRNQLVKRIEALGTHDGKFVHRDGFNQFINETAFTWFNRLTAIRYMEVNEYLDHGFRVLSKTEGAQFGEGFEILYSAADVADELGLNKNQIIDMVLDGDKEEELYRTLLLAQCHQLSEAMPFMFEKLDDATELLLPDNLTKTDSILKDLVNDIPEENWQKIEVIGWLYQFYISDRKKEVTGLASTVVSATDLPVATQIFTPNSIVKFLVQNSLGQKWLATYPDSELKEKMEYYITPAEQSDDVIEQLKAITPTNIDPEEIKVLDPACGSGHILVEVYEVLREIYLERGYRLREIPELILTKNIYGLDIDDRAAQMAAFAVLMKAREDDKRIFTRDIKLNIHSIQSTENLNINQLWADLDLDGNKRSGSIDDLFSESQMGVYDCTASSENKPYLDLLRYINNQFIDAASIGSLMKVDYSYSSLIDSFIQKITNRLGHQDPVIKQAAHTCLAIMHQAKILGSKFDVVVANPPYLGYKGMNSQLKNFLAKHYPQSKNDLYSAFIEQGLNLTKEHGYNAQVTIANWMSLSSYSKFRTLLRSCSTINSIDAHAAGVLIGFETASVVFQKSIFKHYTTSSFSTTKSEQLIARKNLKLSSFSQIKDSPYLLELSEAEIDAFAKFNSLESIAKPRQGLATSDDGRFLRRWHEVDISKTNFASDDAENALKSGMKWFPFNKGGEYRKWYGNNEHLINWENDGEEVKEYAASLYGSVTRTIKNIDFYFQEGITWSLISSRGATFRYVPQGFIYGHKGSGIFSDNPLEMLSFLNSSVANGYLKSFSSGVGIEVGHIKSLPYSQTSDVHVIRLTESCVEIAKKDWDLYETSWDYMAHPMISVEDKMLESAYNKLINSFNNDVEQLSVLENELSANWSQHYNLEPIPTPLHNITLFMNNAYYYPKENEVQSKKKRQSEIFASLLSHFIGSIMGRYSLDREGLVYAHSGNIGFNDLVAEGAYKTFPADDDGIVPLADEDWVFEDDATTCFREFVKTVWGEKHLQENLDFVAESLCLDAIKAKKGESSIDTIRRYFSTQFYKDHLKTYKKRPIYWLFSSGKAKAFECLVYLHRYNEGTLSRMRTEYVTPLMGKLESRKNILEDSKATASGAELRAIDKELKTIEKKQAELVTFDEELKHLAEMKISLDLDDGVKVNYGKFGNLLADVKAIHGKNPEVIK